jgi:hypothetical protein
VSIEQDASKAAVLLQNDLVYPGWSKARTNAAAPLALGDGLSLHLAKLNTFVFKCYGLVQKLLERWKGVRHQLVLEWPNESL